MNVLVEQESLSDWRARVTNPAFLYADWSMCQTWLPFPSLQVYRSGATSSRAVSWTKTHDTRRQKGNVDAAERTIRSRFVGRPTKLHAAKMHVIKRGE